MKYSQIPIKEFIIGGILFSLIKYTADNVEDIRISSVIAALPLGLLSSLLITDKKLQIYSFSYTKNIAVLFLTALVFYCLHKFTKLNRHINLISSMLFWVIINLILLYFF